MIDVNMFTNCTEKYSNDSSLIKNTLDSFKERFGNCINNLNVFIDAQPKEENYEKYKQSIIDNINPNNIIRTNGLADGYIQSTKLCETDYIFQLEHDWKFLDTIKHSIQFLITCMIAEGMDHLRFNKRPNIKKPWEPIKEVEVLGEIFCKTPNRSNNPHIINRLSYLTKWNEMIDLSNTPKRADGIENKLVGTIGYIYGCYRYPQQIEHTNGRK